jgi:hypothetical protein
MPLPNSIPHLLLNAGVSVLKLPTAPPGALAGNKYCMLAFGVGVPVRFLAAPAKGGCLQPQALFGQPGPVSGTLIWPSVSLCVVCELPACCCICTTRQTVQPSASGVGHIHSALHGLCLHACVGCVSLWISNPVRGVLRGWVSGSDGNVSSMARQPWQISTLSVGCRFRSSSACRRRLLCSHMELGVWARG